MSADNERFLDQLVEAGVYPSRRHAIDEAFALLRRREELLKGLRISAEQAARGELLDGSEVLDRFEARAREIEAKARGEAWCCESRRVLLKIWTKFLSISPHRPLTAKSVAARIRAKLELLAKQPLLGEHRRRRGDSSNCRWCPRPGRPVALAR
jgi:hypothetical protein